MGIAAVLLVLAVVVGWSGSPDAAAQTAPVNDADKVFTQLDAAKSRTCGVTTAGYIRCWGNVVNAPVRSNTDGYVEVAVSRSFTCGRRSNGAVDCWSNTSGDIPILPTVPDGDRAGEPVTFSEISASQSHICGILDGQHGQTAGLLQCRPVPSSGAGVRLATVPAELAEVAFGAVDASLFGTCALVKGGADDGKAKCWGKHDSIVVTDALADTAFADISTTGLGACGIVQGGDEAGQVKCWGADFDGEFDDAPETGTFSSLDIGLYHVCALQTDGAPVCWGEARYGASDIPEALSTATFSEVAAGGFHTCGILDGQNSQTAGTVKCWGEQNFETIEANAPALFDVWAAVPYDERPGLPALSAGPGMIDAGPAHTCATTSAGGAACWGSGGQGPPRLTSDIRRISTGFDNTCALKTDGKVECWGGNVYAQSNGADLATTTFSAVSAGTLHTCGILDGQNTQMAGSLICWGWNRYVQSTLPADLAGATFSAVSAGYFYTCGILDGQNNQAEETVRCWGWNQAGLLQSAGLADTAFADVAAGRYHSCGVTTAGRVACWGNVVGTQDLGQTTVPEQYRYARFAAVAADYYHTCAVTTAGKAACWGADTSPTTEGIQVVDATGIVRNTGQADPQPRRPAWRCPWLRWRCRRPPLMRTAVAAR